MVEGERNHTLEPNNEAVQNMTVRHTAKSPRIVSSMFLSSFSFRYQVQCLRHDSLDWDSACQQHWKGVPPTTDIIRSTMEVSWL